MATGTTAGSDKSSTLLCPRDAEVPSQPPTYRYLGLQVPQEVFLSRWGSYWVAILCDVCLPVISTLASAIAGGLMNGWALPVLIPILIMAFNHAILQPTDLLLPFGTIRDKTNTELQVKTFGRRIALIRIVVQVSQAMAASTWHIAIFLYPPFGQQILATVLLTFQDGINVPIMIAGEVPIGRKHWLTIRLARIGIVIGSYLEFGSDFAAGVTAIKRGHLALGIPIILAGIGEFFLTNHILGTGVFEHSKRSVWMHTLLEVPVASLSVLAIANSDLPLKSQAVYIASLAMSVVSIAANFLWLYVLKPCYLKRAASRQSFAVHPDPAEKDPSFNDPGSLARQTAVQVDL